MNLNNDFSGYDFRWQITIAVASLTRSIIGRPIIPERFFLCRLFEQLVGEIDLSKSWCTHVFVFVEESIGGALGNFLSFEMNKLAQLKHISMPF